MKIPRQAILITLSLIGGIVSATSLLSQTSERETHTDNIHTVRKAKQSAYVSTVQRTQLTRIETFSSLLTDRFRFRANLEAISNNWNPSYVPMMLDVARFLPRAPRAQVMGLLEVKTGQSFGGDFDRWLQWSWSQKTEPHPDYARFKSELYRNIDPRFAEYFADAKDPKIRLDEIRWGGVRRDGIPPLKNPQMVRADQATYLADSDVVFGIELNGDARCYPKRILAWHEMFKDTIGGESICGVY